MKLALCQLDARIGDFAGNLGRIRAAAAAAREGGADLSVFPELALTGYPPRDLLFEPAFLRAADEALTQLASDTVDGPALLLGAPRASGRTPPGHPGLYDAAVLLQHGRITFEQGKRLLPAYDVFHEPRWFLPAPASRCVELAGRRLGVLVCEDLWDEGYDLHPAAELVAQGAELLVCLSASPFRAGIQPRRRALAHGRSVPVVYVNAAGANDELIFDGGSFATDATGALLHEAPRFREAVQVIEPFAPGPPLRPEPIDSAAELRAAIVEGIRGFCRKNGLRQALFGLSGGVDSALVACLAAEALGPAAVTGVAMPSRYNDPRSLSSAQELARALGIELLVQPIEALHAATAAALGPLVEGPEGRLTDENVQARLRMVVLMAHVNRRGGVLLNTSNQTELTYGYGTLYGDLAGTLAPLGDLTKSEVFALARTFPQIPRFILERPPSAELSEGQVDPFDYAAVSPLAAAVARQQPLPAGAAPADVERVRRLAAGSEHKRRQAGIVLKLSERAFGSGRMIPVTKRWM